VTILLEVAAVVALMLVNGLLAMSELALMFSRRGRLEQLAQAGDRGARAALRLLDDPTAFLSTVQVGITLVGILAGAISGATLGGHLAAALAGLGIPRGTADLLGIGGVVVALTYLSLVVGELVPKRLALAFPERAASRVARPLASLARAGSPVVWLLRASTDAVLRLLRVAAEPGARVTEEEIRALLAEGAQAGVVEPVEHELIEGVMQVATARSARS
jgi:putative hemolysin